MHTDKVEPDGILVWFAASGIQLAKWHKGRDRNATSLVRVPKTAGSMTDVGTPRSSNNKIK